MTISYFFMLWFVFWCAWIIAQKHYKVDVDSKANIVVELLVVLFIRLLFASLATYFFHSIW